MWQWGSLLVLAVLAFGRIFAIRGVFPLQRVSVLRGVFPLLLSPGDVGFVYGAISSLLFAILFGPYALLQRL